MLRSWRLAALAFTAFAMGLALGLVPCYLIHEEMVEVPEDVLTELERLKFINRDSGQVLTDFKVLGGVVGKYDVEGPLYETYILGFEDRPNGAEADQDYLDLIVELKRVKGGGKIVVRLVQLGHDTIDVYLDGEFLGSLRPAMELILD